MWDQSITPTGTDGGSGSGVTTPPATTNTTGTNDVSNQSNGIGIAMAASMDTFLRHHDHDDDILEFQNITGTYSTPKPPAGFFQPPPPEHSSLISTENGGSTYTVGGGSVTESNGDDNGNNGSNGLQTPQPQPSPPPPAMQHQENGNSGPSFQSLNSSPGKSDLSEGATSLDHREIKPLNPTATVYKCDHCDKVFKSTAQLNMHMRKTHPEMVPPESPEPTDNNDSETRDNDKAGATYTVPTVPANEGTSEEPNQSSTGEGEREGASVASVDQADGGRPAYKCDICHTSYGSSSHLKRHFTTVTHREKVKGQGAANGEAPQERQEYKCDVCHVDAKDAHALRRHYLTAIHQKNVRASTGAGDEEDENQQQEQGQDGQNSGSRRQSQRQRQPPRTTTSRFKCELCSINFDTQYHLDRHQKSRTHISKAEECGVGQGTSPSGLSYECATCRVSYPSEVDLEHHYLTAHLSLTQEEIGAPAGSWLGEPAGTSRGQAETSTLPKNLSCDVCGFRFKDSYHLRRHFMSQSHQRKVAEIPAIPEVVLQEEEATEEDQGQSLEPDARSSGIFHCESCNTNYNSARQIKRHYATAMHKQNFAARNGNSEDEGSGNRMNSNFTIISPSASVHVRTSLTAVRGSDDPKRKYHCEVCNTFYLTSSHLRRHFTTTSHLAMVQTGGGAAETRVAIAAASKQKSSTKSASSAGTPSSSQFCCNECGAKCSNMASLNMHMKKVHPSPPEVKQEPLIDDEYESAVDETPRRISAGGNRTRLACDICNASYRGTYDLQRHYGTLLHRTNVQAFQGGAAPATTSRKRVSEPPPAPKPKSKKAKPKKLSQGAVVGLGHFLGPFAAPAVERFTGKINGKKGDKTKPRCDVCNKFYYSNKDLRKHFLTQLHRQTEEELRARGYQVTEDGGRVMGGLGTGNVAAAQEESMDVDEDEEENTADMDMDQMGHIQPGSSLVRASTSSSPGRSPPKRVRLACDTCRTTYQGQRDLDRHLGTQKHLNAVRDAQSGTSSGHRVGPKSKTRGQFKCTTCETSHDTADGLEEHKRSSSHLTAVRITETGNQNGVDDGVGTAGVGVETAAGGEVD